ncbi:MAG: EAL domain-containing protein, partial [Actinomycetota bacterium]
LADADLAMYSAKLAGKGEWRSFEPSMRSIEEQRSEIRRALRSGVTEGSVELHYQPVVELDSGVVVGLEALVRWRHPERGLLSPGQFLAQAEETGVSVALGHQVLDAVAAHRDRWLDERDPVADLPIAINMSARELREPTLVDRFAELVDVGRFRTGHLIVEVSEPAVDGAVEDAVRVLNELQDLGVDVALDDFGAGPASVTYLTRIRADYAKLERRLSAELVTAGGDDRMMRGLVALCREIEVVPIAEGIEDPNQATLVRSLGIPLGQGYLFSRPLPVDAISEVVRTRGSVPAPLG